MEEGYSLPFCFISLLSLFIYSSFIWSNVKHEKSSQATLNSDFLFSKHSDLLLGRN